MNSEQLVYNNYLREWMPFSELKRGIRSYEIKNRSEWFTFWTKHERASNIPSNPDKIYYEWQSWADFLGTNNIAPKNREYISYSNLKKFCKKIGIKSQNQFYQYWKTHSRPQNIPTRPYDVYKEWKNWGDFLGTGKIATRKQKFVSYNYLKKFCKEKEITSQLSFRNYWKIHTRPSNIPSNPDKTYKKEWKSWYDLTGKYYSNC